MSLFHTILSQIETTLKKQSAHNNCYAEVVSRVVGVTISPDVCTYKEGVLYIKTPPTIKMAIALREKKIIEAFSAQHITVHSIR